MKRIILFLVIHFLGLSANAKVGTEGGNGGGVICINGKCQTLIEAGLRLNPEYDGVWLPPADAYTTVKSNLDIKARVLSSVRDEIYFSVFGRADHFRKVQVIDPDKLEAIRNQYLEISAAAGFPIDPNTFEIVAFSSDETVQPALTYLLPKFFQLNADQQAQILLHEGLYRGRPSSYLKYVLQFESSLASSGKSPAVILDQQILSYRLGYIDRAQLVGTMLSVVLGERIKMEGLGSIKESNDMMILDLDPKKILGYAKLEPRFPYIFSKMKNLTFEKRGPVTFEKIPPPSSLYIPWYAEKSELSTELCQFHSRPAGENIYKCSTYFLVDKDLDLMLPH